MLAVAARIPDAAGRDQFADRIAHKARITEDVVRAEIRKAAVNRQTTVTTRELPSFGQLKDAEKALIWGLIHNTKVAVQALAELDEDDLETLAGRHVLELAPSLHDRAIGSLTLDAVAASKYGGRPARDENCSCREIASSPAECVRALKRLRWERERAAIKREIDRLQELGVREYGHEIDTLSRRLLAVAVQLDRDLN